MNEHQLGRLLRRLILLSAPLPLAALGAACGGSAADDLNGSAGVGGSSAGASGSSAGAGGSAAGAGGSGAGAGGSSAGAGGSGAGAGGASSQCTSHTMSSCSPESVTLPKMCLGALAVVDTPIPQAMCHQLCN